MATTNKNDTPEVINETPEVINETPEVINETPEVIKDPYQVKVQLYIPPPMSNSEEKDVIVYHNGRNWIMPKGGTYEVPECVAAEYHRAMKARTRGMKRKTDMVHKEQKINAHADAVINGKA